MADALVPPALRPAWDGFCRRGLLALAAVIVLPVVAGLDLFRWPVEGALFLIRHIAP